jgi:Amt family ammonium transporter
VYWFVGGTVTLDKLKIDDPVGAVPVHLVNGAWGVIATGLFAVGNPDTAGWNGVQAASYGRCMAT